MEPAIAVKWRPQWPENGLAGYTAGPSRSSPRAKQCVPARVRVGLVVVAAAVAATTTATATTTTAAAATTATAAVAAATAATAAATAAEAAAAATAATTATRAALHRLGDLERTAIEGLPVHGGNRRLGLGGVGQLDERETPGLPGLTISHD